MIIDLLAKLAISKSIFFHPGGTCNSFPNCHFSWLISQSESGVVIVYALSGIKIKSLIFFIEKFSTCDLKSVTSVQSKRFKVIKSDNFLKGCFLKLLYISRTWHRKYIFLPPFISFLLGKVIFYDGNEKIFVERKGQWI